METKIHMHKKVHVNTVYNSQNLHNTYISSYIFVHNYLPMGINNLKLHAMQINVTNEIGKQTKLEKGVHIMCFHLYKHKSWINNITLRIQNSEFNSTFPQIQVLPTLMEQENKAVGISQSVGNAAFLYIGWKLHRYFNF